VLNIEVLAASGAREAAARRAKRFIAQHPTSPHTAALTRFVDGN
jgi:hypothetical protein